MEFHKIASIFPLMEGSEFESLVDDIKTNGLIEPIYLYEDKILDGRNRYRACNEAGVEPKFEKYVEDDPLGFVISLNLKRRHLNESQRAVVASRLANMTAGRKWKSNSANLPDNISQPEAAKLLNVSERTIRSVKVIEREEPEIIPEIESGNITVHQAEKKIKTEKRKEERAKLAEQGAQVANKERWNVYHGNIETIELNKQYDFIITDPPYPKEYLPLYETLAIRSNEWLKDGGLLVAMCGQSYLNEIYAMLSKHLTYYWTAAYLTPGQPTPLRQVNVNTTWKPLLMFRKGQYKGKIFGDVFKSDHNEKEYHKWGQSESGMYDIISKICLPGQSVLDPFCGAGTTGTAVLRHGCFFDGVEIDVENVNISRARLNDTKTI